MYIRHYLFHCENTKIAKQFLFEIFRIKKNLASVNLNLQDASIKGCYISFSPIVLCELQNLLKIYFRRTKLKEN